MNTITHSPSEAMLKRLRRVALPHLSQTARIERPTDQQDDYGVPDGATYTTIANNVSARVLSGGGGMTQSESPMVVNETDVDEESLIILMPYETNVEPNDRIWIARQAYHALGVNSNRTETLLTRVKVTKVRGQ